MGDGWVDVVLRCIDGKPLALYRRRLASADERTIRQESFIYSLNPAFAGPEFFGHGTALRNN
jgi:hypothetical protein